MWPRASSLPDVRSIHAFVSRAYQVVLGREVDEHGLDYYGDLLQKGALRREDFLLTLVDSTEHAAFVFRRHFAMPDIRSLNPGAYVHLDSDDGARVEMYVANSAERMDWIHQTILETGFYERPSGWTQGLDDDKRFLANLLLLFDPRRVLEVGCSTGALLEHLQDRGVAEVAGLDLSVSARIRASDAIRGAIHVGQLEHMSLDSRFDIVAGFDVFEHLHPRDIGKAIQNVRQHLEDDGIVIANIPAFGPDAVLGERFSIWTDEWRRDSEAGQPFRHLQVDESGFPQWGHLIWADASWWTKAFEDQGLLRCTEAESLIQKRFAPEISRFPARGTMFVFSPTGAARRQN